MLGGSLEKSVLKVIILTQIPSSSGLIVGVAMVDREEPLIFSRLPSYLHSKIKK